jgi:hypothetical protein
MASFQQSDERRHQPGPHRHWNESFYVNFFDIDGNWGGASRIGFSPNQGAADGFVCLYFPDGATGFIRTWDICSDHLDRCAGGPIEHVCVRPFEEWRLRYEGPIYYFEDPAQMGDFGRSMLTHLPQKQVELDVKFEAIHDVFDFHVSMKRRLLSPGELLRKLKPSYLADHLGPAMRKVALLRTMSGAEHYEHAGRVDGRITVDGQTHEFTGFGQRDHSWGVRDMRVPASWRWFSCQFKDEMCFNAIRVEVLGIRASGGYVYHQGQAEALKDWSFQAQLDDSGRWARSVSIMLVAASGSRFEVTGTALANIPVLATTGGTVSLVNEARMRFSWRDRTGYGISEFMGQLL